MIRMSRLVGLFGLGMAACSFGTCVDAQTVERDTTITGPRGRTIQRDVEIKRSPGSIERQVQIKRPGGTLDRSVQVQRSPLMGPWRPPIGSMASSRLDPAACGGWRSGSWVWCGGRPNVELLLWRWWRRNWRWTRGPRSRRRGTWRAWGRSSTAT